MFEAILNATDAGVETFVFSTWQRFIDASGPFLTSLLVIALAILGYRLMVGQIQMSLSELGYRVFVLFLFYGLIIRIDDLNAFFYTTFTDVPGSVASFMVSSIGGEPVQLNASVSEIFSRGVGSFDAIVQDAGVTNPAPYLYAGLIVLVTLLAVGVIAFVLVLSKLATGVLLGLAPFALVLYFFQSTRSIFDGYLRQLLTFALIPILLYSLIGLMFGMVDSVSLQLSNAAGAGADSFGLIASYSLVLVVWALVSIQVLPWSAGIAGGLALAAPAGVARAALGSVTQSFQTAKRAAQAQVLATRLVRPELSRTGTFMTASRGLASAATRGVLGMRQRQQTERFRGTPSRPKPRREAPSRGPAGPSTNAPEDRS